VRAPAHAHDVEVVEQQPVDLDARDLPVGEAHDQQPTASTQTAQGVGDAVTTDRIQHEVDPLAAGQLPYRLPEALDGDHLVGPRGAGHRRLLLGRGDGDHVRIPSDGQLDRRDPDTTARAVDQQPFTGAQPTTVEQCEVDGQQVHRQPGCHLEVDLVGEREHQVRRHQHGLGEAAQPGNAATRCPATRPEPDGASVTTPPTSAPGTNGGSGRSW
jgi:hypothetical protein